jgi:hypothetical protein
VKIAKRPQAGEAAPAAPAASAPKAKVLSIGGDGVAKVEKPIGAKVLSIGGDSAPKVEKTGGVKVLTIGATKPAEPSPAKQNVNKAAPEAGAKVAAAKAIEKTGESTGSAASRSGATSPSPSSGRNSPTMAEKRAAARAAEDVAKEQAEDVDESVLNEVYGKVPKIIQSTKLDSMKASIANYFIGTRKRHFPWSCRRRQIHTGRLYIIRYGYGGRANHGEIQTRSERGRTRDMVPLLGTRFNQRGAIKGKDCRGWQRFF